MTTVHHRYITVREQQLFYREAGPASAPTALLLHGFPTSSATFRDLIPLLADRYRVIVPDHLGSGLSDAPSVTEFRYTFDALACLTADLLHLLGISRFVMYVQDYGAPIGWRIALADPGAVIAIISQSGNGCDVGFTEEFWGPVREYRRDRTPRAEAVLRRALTLEAIRWQYLHGVRDQTLVNPGTWYHDFALVSRPGNDLVQLQLLADQCGDLALYPRLHRYLRNSGVPLLVIWGRNDEILGVQGALAFADHSPGAQICLLDGGHFLLESHLDVVADTVRGFLERALPPS